MRDDGHKQAQGPDDAHDPVLTGRQILIFIGKIPGRQGPGHQDRQHDPGRIDAHLETEQPEELEFTVEHALLLTQGNNFAETRSAHENIFSA